jgi:hypothetical protein
MLLTRQKLLESTLEDGWGGGDFGRSSAFQLKDHSTIERKKNSHDFIVGLYTMDNVSKAFRFLWKNSKAWRGCGCWAFLESENSCLLLHKNDNDTSVT